MTKGNMAKDVTEIFAKFGEKYKIASEDANAYAAAASDIIFNTPSVSGQERIFKYDIPFYQMVFKGYVAMTGEISLRGRVLPIGGLKEKTMAALRHGIRTVIIPQDNLRDLEEIDPVVRQALHFVPAQTMDTVLETALNPKMESAPAIFGEIPQDRLVKNRKPDIRQ